MRAHVWPSMRTELPQCYCCDICEQWCCSSRLVWTLLGIVFRSLLSCCSCFVFCLWLRSKTQTTKTCKEFPWTSHYPMLALCEVFLVCFGHLPKIRGEESWSFPGTLHQHLNHKKSRWQLQCKIPLVGRLPAAPSKLHQVWKAYPVYGSSPCHHTPTLDYLRDHYSWTRSTRFHWESWQCTAFRQCLLYPSPPSKERLSYNTNQNRLWLRLLLFIWQLQPEWLSSC